MKIHPDMMTSDEIPERVMYVHDILTQFREREISPAPYFRVLLSGDSFNDELDPDHLAQPATSTYYYPGGVTGLEPHRRLTFHDPQVRLTAEDMDIQALREKLKTVKIGAEATKRFNQSPSAEVLREIKDTHTGHGQDPLDTAVRMTTMYDLPIAAVEFRRILQHKNAEPGDSLAILTSFGLVHPVRALRLVQASIREDEIAEDPRR